jgi:hypothetical protein
MVNFELKLEIPNIMLVCKFEINWSTNKNLRVLTTYDGRNNGRPAFPYPPLRFVGAWGQQADILSGKYFIHCVAVDY